MWIGPKFSWADETYGSFRFWHRFGGGDWQTWTWPPRAWIHSPGIPISRFTNVTDATREDCSACSPTPFGWNTMISPRDGSLKRYQKRAAITRSSTRSVRTIEGDGTR